MSKRPAPSQTNPKSHLHLGEAVDTTAEQDALGADFEALEKELEKMATERQNLHEQLLRTMADMQNYKRRVEQERVQIQLRATEALLKELLPVLDSFDRTLAAAEAGASAESMSEGIQIVNRQLRGVLEGRKLTRIAAKGEHFDPAAHDAVLIDTESDLPPGTVVEELEAGYRLGEQVIRPARVKVAKGI